MFGLKERLNQWIWGQKLLEMDRWQAYGMTGLRYLTIILRDLFNGDLNLRAMSLVFTTLLSLVPLLAVSFSILKAFGVHNQIEELLLPLLAPLGPKGPEVTAKIVEFVENIKVGVLGSMGLVLLIYTVVSLIQKIEGAFNHIWHIGRPRHFVQRFSEYLSIILVGPVLIFSAMGMMATVKSTALMQAILDIEFFGAAYLAISEFLPFFFIVIAFSFFYIFIPNTRVRLLPAIVGGVAAGLLWQFLGWGFASFVVTSSNYSAVYSGFAILMLFMIWVYISWLILLLGSQVSFYVQYPECVRLVKDQFRMSNQLKENLSLSILLLLAQAAQDRTQVWHEESLAEEFGLWPRDLEEVIEMLMDLGWVIKSQEPEAHLYLAQDPDAIELGEVVRVLRQYGAHGVQNLSSELAGDMLISSIEISTQNHLKGLSLKKALENNGNIDATVNIKKHL